MRNLLRTLLCQNSQWFCERVFFVSWGKWWKGVYVHFLPCYTVRVFFWGVDWRRKAWKGVMQCKGCPECRP